MEFFKLKIKGKNWGQENIWKHKSHQYKLLYSKSEMVYLRWELKPSQNQVWDSNPCGWDSNPTKTSFGTWTHVTWTWTQQKTHSTWFQDLMKLRFLMPHCSRKNSVRDKVIGKKWVYSDSERSTLHRQSVGHCRGLLQPSKVFFVCWVISYVNQWTSLIAQLVKNLPACRSAKFNFWVGKTSWRGKWQPTPVFLPGESHGQRQLAGYSSWSCKSQT